MSAAYARSLVVFRRDLRIHDNTALNAALESSAEVVPLFIFDPRQLLANPYRSDNCVQFMLESLRDLDDALRREGSGLVVEFGEAESVIADYIGRKRIDAVYLNRDYTPFSVKRDELIRERCLANGAAFHAHDDVLLFPPELTRKADSSPYTVFTPFFKNAGRLAVPEPRTAVLKALCRRAAAPPLAQACVQVLGREKLNPELYVRGGRAQALLLLERVGSFAEYSAQRDIPALGATTGLSAHNKFGTCSIREVFHRIRSVLGPDSPLLRQLYWRDFFHSIAFYFPHVFGAAFNRKYDAVEWDNDERLLNAWSEGMTGFPIVDAGMRQLNTTGFMHNRVRMIVASFLTKDLHLDWRLGERYFASKLVDYDPCVNNGSWQWAASTGCDAQPYFRIFNPWLQQKKFDPDCAFIKRWVPELVELSARQIHNLDEHMVPALKNYPRPIVDHGRERLIAEERFEDALRG